MTVGTVIRRRQDRLHARHCNGLIDVYRLDIGMGVRRPQHVGAQLMRQVVIVRIPPAAGQKSRVLGARNRLPDVVFTHP